MKVLGSRRKVSILIYHLRKNIRVSDDYFNKLPGVRTLKLSTLILNNLVLWNEQSARNKTIISYYTRSRSSPIGSTKSGYRP